MREVAVTIWRPTSRSVMAWKAPSTAVMHWTPPSVAVVPWVARNTAVMWRAPYAASEAISKAKSHSDIHKAMESYSGAVVDPRKPTLLYSGPVEVVSKQDSSKKWTFSSEHVTQQVAKATGANIVNDTERALLLTHPLVDMAISKKLIQLEIDNMRRQGTPLTKPIDLRALQTEHLYGAHENSQWGRLSKHFNASAQNQVIVIATNANLDRVLSKVELPEIFKNLNVVTISGLDRANTQKSLLSGSMTHSDVFALSQQPCIDSIKKGGLFISADNRLMLSKEFTEQLGLVGARLPSGADLLAKGYVPLDAGRAITLPKIDPDKLATLLPPRSAVLVNTGASPTLTKDDVVLSSARGQGGSSPHGQHSSAAELLARLTQTVNDLQSGNRDSSRTSIHALANTDSAHQMQSQAKATVTEQQTTQQRSSQTQATQQQGSQTPQQSHPTTPTTPTNSGNGTPHR